MYKTRESATDCACVILTVGIGRNHPAALAVDVVFKDLGRQAGRPAGGQREEDTGGLA